MKKMALLLFVLCLTTQITAQEAVSDTTFLTVVGQKAPDFKLTRLDGSAFHLEAMKGKVVWLNFFATWCPPCKAELPVLEEEVYHVFQGKDFEVICVGREHTADELKAFRGERALNLPMAPDPERAVYAQFATQFIPRNYVIDQEGKIAHQSRGYTEEEFREIIDKVKDLLK